MSNEPAVSEDVSSDSTAGEDVPSSDSGSSEDLGEILTDIPLSMVGTWWGKDDITGNNVQLTIHDNWTGNLDGKEISEFVLRVDKTQYRGTLKAGDTTYEIVYFPPTTSSRAEIALFVEDGENYSFDAHLTYRDGGEDSIPVGVAGTWSGKQEEGKEYTLVISASGAITLNGTAATDISDWSLSSSNNPRVSFTVGGVEYTATYRGTSILLTTNDMLVYCDLYTETSDDEALLPAEIVGTWVGTEENSGDTYTLIVNANGNASLNGVASTGLLEYTGTPVGGYGEVTFAGVVYDIQYNPVHGLKIFTSSSLNPFSCPMERSEDSAGGLIETTYVGTWQTRDAAHTHAITSDAKITYDGTEGAFGGWISLHDAYWLVIGDNNYYFRYAATYGQNGGIYLFTLDASVSLIFYKV